MGISDFFTSVEFYVIATVVAAAVLGLCVKPQSKGPVRQHLLAGRLRNGEHKSPGLELMCREDGSVELLRTGVDDLTDAGAVSLAVSVSGFNITIKERVTLAECGEARNEALFVLDFLAPEYYHIRYESDDTSLFCAFTLHVRPGIKTRKELGH
ncbi:MAG: hypothetical protein K2O88_04925 [Paramuribaculum sp.]|nr:hypothetical protein [Paramuribaculum sp.]